MLVEVWGGAEARAVRGTELVGWMRWGGGQERKGPLSPGAEETATFPSAPEEPGPEVWQLRKH